LADEAGWTSARGRVLVDAMDGSLIKGDGVHIGVHGDNKHGERRQPGGGYIGGRRWGIRGSGRRESVAGTGDGRHGSGSGGRPPTVCTKTAAGGGGPRGGEENTGGGRWEEDGVEAPEPEGVRPLVERTSPATEGAEGAGGGGPPTV
jgi:hypothetical protein